MTAEPASGVTLPALYPAILVVYAGALVQGMALVSVPTLSAMLTQTYGLTDAQYGFVFLPQVACAVLGALLGGTFAKRVGLKPLLALSLAITAVSQALLASLVILPGTVAFAGVLASTAALGLGFGISGAPMNSFPPLLFPRHPHGAVVAMHMVVGVGLCVGPLLAAELVKRDAWAVFPLLLVALTSVLALASAAPILPRGHPGDAAVGASPMAAGSDRVPVRAPMFWVFFTIVVLYAFAEGTFSNWAVIYLRDAKSLPEVTASLALSAFWGAVVAGRLAASVLVTRMPPTTLWATLPLIMIAAFVLMPGVASSAQGIALFALAGLGCSAFLPLSITLASHRFPQHVAWVSSMLIAALMIGIGVGSFTIGTLRDILSFESLYRVSIIYPMALLLLAIPVLRARRTLAPAQ